MKTKVILAILVTLSMLILSIGYASAWTSSDFTANTEKIGSDTNYGKYTIEESKWWDVFQIWTNEVVREQELTSNTESCGQYCEEIQNITLYKDAPLIEDRRYYRILDDGSKELSNIRSDNFYIQDKVEEIVVYDYSLVCKETGEIEKNGTAIQDCNNEKVGSHIEYKPTWKEYQVGEIVPAGSYIVKHTGEKRADWSYDWQVKINGRWTEEWAIWLGGKNYVLEENPNLILSSSGSNTNKYGVKIKPFYNMTLINITRYDGGTPTKCYLYNGTSYAGGTLLSNGTVVGENCNLNYNLTENVQYILAMDAGGGSYTLKYNTTSTSGYQYNTGTERYLNYTNGSDSLGTNTSDWYSIGNITVNIYSLMPYLTLNSPVNYYNSSSSSVTFNATAIGYTADWTNMSLWTNVSGAFQINNTLTATGTSDNKNWTISLPDGNYNWSIQACDSDGDCGFSENRTISVDTTTPTITINSGNGTQNYGVLTTNHTINFTASDIRLQACWIQYNGTNITAPCTSGAMNSTSIALVLNGYNATLWANDSLGNLGRTNFSWNYNFFEEGSVFDSIVYETDYLNFRLNISSAQTILSMIPILIYNGTNYTGTATCNAGLCSAVKSMDIPLLPVGESVNRTFYWYLTLYSGTSSFNLQTSASTQQTDRIHLEECNTTYPLKALNFTAYREDNLTKVSPYKIDGTFNYWLGSGSIYRNISASKASTQNLSMCLTPAPRTQKVNAYILYSFENENISYMPRNYYLSNHSIDNSTEEIKLYLLEDSDSTTFIIKVQNQQTEPVADAYVYIQRYYPGTDSYETVQVAKTDENGKSIGFYEVETVDYKHIIIKDGVTLLETDKGKIVGEETPFTLTFTIGAVSELPWEDYTDNENITTNLSFNEDTKIVSFTYIEGTEEVTSGRLLVLKRYANNATEIIICNSSSGLSASTLTCNLSAYDDGTFVAHGYVNEVIEEIINFAINKEARDIMGKTGLFVGLFIILVAGLTMLWNPTAGVIAVNVAVIATNLIGFIQLSPVLIIGMVAVSVITVVLLKT